MPKLSQIVIVLLLVVNNTTAQSLKISERQIFKTFQKTILKNKNGSITTGRSAWHSCNDDEAFFKLDTISLIHYPNMSSNNKCCNSITWTFYEKNKLLETRHQKCKEPPSSSAAKSSDFYKISYTTSGDSSFLTFLNKDGKNFTFQILELIESSVENSDKPSYELILKRHNRKHLQPTLAWHNWGLTNKQSAVRRNSTSVIGWSVT